MGDGGDDRTTFGSWIMKNVGVVGIVALPARADGDPWRLLGLDAMCVI
jgi:hypothetical protein